MQKYGLYRSCIIHVSIKISCAHLNVDEADTSLFVYLLGFSGTVIVHGNN